MSENQYTVTKSYKKMTEFAIPKHLHGTQAPVLGLLIESMASRVSQYHGHSCNHDKPLLGSCAVQYKFQENDISLEDIVSSSKRDETQPIPYQLPES